MRGRRGLVPLAIVLLGGCMVSGLHEASRAHDPPTRAEGWKGDSRAISCRGAAVVGTSSADPDSTRWRRRSPRQPNLKGCGGQVARSPGPWSASNRGRAVSHDLAVPAPVHRDSSTGLPVPSVSPGAAGSAPVVDMSYEIDLWVVRRRWRGGHEAQAPPPTGDARLACRPSSDDYFELRPRRQRELLAQTVRL